MNELTEDYKDFLLESLADPEEALLYLKVALEQDDLEVLTMSLQDVMDAVALKQAKRLAEDASISNSNLVEEKKELKST